MKQIAIKRSIKDPDVTEMFNQMVLGIDPSIVIPKYELIQEETNIILLSLEKFTNSNIRKLMKDFESSFKMIDDFVELSRKIMEMLKLNENEYINTNIFQSKREFINKDLQYKINHLSEKYKKLKNCLPIQNFIFTLRLIENSLKIEKERSNNTISNLDDKDNLSNDFIINATGDFLPLLNFTTLDFKQIYLQYANEIQENPDINQYILQLLCIIYKRSKKIVNAIMSPDLDVERISHILISIISEAKKQIPRCNRAFSIIEQSVDVLKNNFNEYYKDFTISNNPTIIIEDFVRDLIKRQDKTDARLIAEFRRIVNFYQKRMKVNTDPKVNKIIGLIDDNINSLEKETKINQ